MKNSGFESIEKKALSDKEFNSDSDSEKTDEEIIYNDCVNEEEEFLDTETHETIYEQNSKNLQNEINIIQPKNKSNKKNIKKPQGNLTNIHIEEPKSRKNKFHSYYSPKFDFAKKKRKKIEEVKTANDLFTEAFKKNNIKNSTNNEFDQEGNTMSTKISDIMYHKYVGQNDKKLNTTDVVISKMKDEELNLNKEALRTKDDSKRINSMITRQEIFQKKKISKLQEKEKELNDKLTQECIFMPNGIATSSRTIKDFNESQKKFLKDKQEEIDKIYKEIYEDKNKNKKIVLTSKQSEKIASAKNPNESKEQMYDRLHFEKLKNLKENYEKPKEEKKMTKKEINNLSNKLYKESIILKENKDKLTKEKLKKEINQEEHISDNSNKVLLSKFLNYYEKILTEIFHRSDNFQININEYKMILNNMGCINPNLQSDEMLIKESFFNILNPKDDKIETDSLLLFCLAALGIYKGNDDIKKTTIISQSNDNKKDKIPNNNRTSLNKLLNRKNEKPKIKTINEILISSLPKIDFEKIGFSNKIAKNIKLKFHHFIKGINESWSGDITKKKQERQEKLQMSYGKKPKSHSKNKKLHSNEIKNSTIMSNKSNNCEIKEINNNNINNDNNKITNKNKTINTNTNKYDEMYKRLQFRKDNNLKALQKKKEEDELALCTFQPNVDKRKNSNSKNKNININKNQNKANKKQIQQNIEKLYQEGKAAYIEKKKSIDPDPEDNLENKINCTFKPVIHKFNNEVFINNPIKEDIQKIEKIGVQKINQIEPKEYSKPMNFYIEPKINKEDIIDRVIPERISASTSIRNEDMERESKTALLKVEVNLDENNNTDKIIIYPGDDVREKTLQFCAKHKLNEEKKNTLMNIIMEKIEENQNIERISDNRNFNNNFTEDNNRISDSIKKDIELINIDDNNNDRNGENDTDNKE